MDNPLELQPQDTKLLRLSFDLARRAAAAGNNPFGAVLADRSGNILLEAENTVVTDHDITGHAETNLVRMIKGISTEVDLAGCTLYASNEPCAMCSGAIYWAGIGRVVYGLSQERFYSMLGGERERSALSLPCRDVLAKGGRSVEVVGPALQDEAALVHEGTWF